MRTHAEQSLLVVFNLSDVAQEWQVPDGMQPEALDVPGVSNGTAAGRLQLPAHAVWMATLA